jgi:energy-coupling factor transporter ATP-binding protein EcfA2
MPLADLLTTNLPFGPIDQALISNGNDAVDVLGLYGPLPRALSGDYTLVYGRKGCGKTSFISMLTGIERSRLRLEHEHIKLLAVYRKSLIISIDTAPQFLAMNTNVIRYVREKTKSTALEFADYDYTLIPSEVIAKGWINEIWDTILQKMYGLLQSSTDLSAEELDLLAPVEVCFDDDAMAAMRGTTEYVSSAVFEAAKESIKTFMLKREMYICVLIDSLDAYPMFNKTFGLSMKGFLKALSILASPGSRLKIVFMLPEELFSHFRDSSSNIMKDFSTAYPMRWSPFELLQITAHRYKLSLSVLDEDYYASFAPTMDLHERESINELFTSLLPDYTKNELGIKEPTRAYIIRHTQLLPRHFLYIFNKIASISWSEKNNLRSFVEDSIAKGIHSVEETIAADILHPYEVNYKKITTNLNGIFGDLPPFFTYGTLQTRLNRLPDKYDLSDHQLVELLFRIGIIGRVCTLADDDQDKPLPIYTPVDFYFNSSGNISFSGKDELCFHPVFSRQFNASRHRAPGDVRLVYPRGVKPDGLA